MCLLIESCDEALWHQCGLNNRFVIKADLAWRHLWQSFPQRSSNCSRAKIFMSLRISTPVVSDFMLLMAHFMQNSRKGRRAAFPGWIWTHLLGSCPTLFLRYQRRAHNMLWLYCPAFLFRLLRARGWTCRVVNWWNRKNKMPVRWCILACSVNGRPYANALPVDIIIRKKGTLLDSSIKWELHVCHCFHVTWVQSPVLLPSIECGFC